jgi:hypothetical protein
MSAAFQGLPNQAAAQLALLALAAACADLVSAAAPFSVTLGGCNGKVFVTLPPLCLPSTNT